MGETSGEGHAASPRVVFWYHPGMNAIRNRRTLKALMLALAVAAAGCSSAPAGQGQAVHVVLTSTCMCCKGWVAHMRDNGFAVTTEEVGGDALGALKREHNIGPPLAACHTATVEGYVVEGHVPADAVARLLAERPAIAGIAVPGMPAGSPGMESPQPEPYRILAFDENGQMTGVFDRR